MAWRIEFTRNADKAMRKLDKDVAARVFDELDEIAKLEDPRSRGKALTGNLAGVWRYRVGDYRILCDINDENDEHTVLDVADDLVVADPIAPKTGKVAHQRLAPAHRVFEPCHLAYHNEGRASLARALSVASLVGPPNQ